jgi:hypothetical protein
MTGQRVGFRDLENFARQLLQYARSNGVDTSWFKRDTVGALWELLEELPRYAFSKRWRNVEMFTAESGTPWDETHRADRIYLRTEGYAFDRRSLAALPIDREAWDYSFFRGNAGAWFLLRAWVHYLKHAAFE